MDRYILQNYDLSGGSANWTTDSIPGYINYSVEYIWRNVTGTLDGSLLIRETSDDKIYNSLNTDIINVADKTHVVPFINFNQDKLNIKLSINNITNGSLSIRIKATENVSLINDVYTPGTNNLVDIGSPTRRFKDMYFNRIIGVKVNLVNKTSAYTATSIDDTILCDASDGAFSITLSTASDSQYKIYNIKKTDNSANSVTVDGDGAKIDGSTTKILTSQYDAIKIQCDGNNWHIL